MTRKFAREWPLATILAAQTVLTVPWLWRTAPFSDEALYLYAGHQLWAHWLHHTALPDYASWFSGVPVLYPPLGALADSIGGLVGARALSLILMLGTTTVVYSVGSRLFGRQTAFFASVLFAVSGLVVHYGAFATYDAMAVLFLALSMWAVVRSRDGGYRWIAGGVAALVIANSAKYATLAWDPIVIGIITLHSWERGVARALGRAMSLSTAVLIMDVGLLAVAGPGYVHGVSTTTVFRTIRWSYDSPSSVLWRSLALIGVLVLTAALGVLVSALRKNPLPVTALLGLLVLAALITPLDQARIHELPSLDKNMGFGLPFAAVAAGYAISAGSDWLSERFLSGKIAAMTAAGVLILLVLIFGREQIVQFRGPSKQAAAQVVSAISKSYEPGTYLLIDGVARVEQYYLSRIPTNAWIGISNPSPAQRTHINQLICAGRVPLVTLRVISGKYQHAFDPKIRELLERTQHYKLAVEAGKARYVTQVWELKGTTGSGICA